MLSATDALPLRPRRVLVAGVSGVGKTTLAVRIAAMTGGLHTEIDALYHGQDWVPREEFLDDVQALVSQDAWTTEWQYGSVRQLLVERADLLVWIDLPFLRVTLPRVVRRTILRRVRREHLWNGNVEPPLWTFFTDREHIIRWAISTRGKYGRLVREYELVHPELAVVRLRSQDEVDRWLTTVLADAVRDRPADGWAETPEPRSVV